MKKEINIRLGWIILAILVAGLIYTSYKWSMYKRDVHALSSQLQQKNSNLHTFKIVVDGMQETITETKTLLIESNRALRNSEAYGERLRKLGIRKANMIGSLEFEVSSLKDSLKVTSGTVIVDSIYIESGTTGGPSIELPLSFGVEDDWMVAWAEVDVNSLGTVGFKLKNTPLEITVGSRGFIRPSYVASVASSNPHLVITDQSITVVGTKKKSKLLYIGGGIILGGVVTLLLVK